MRRGGNDAPPAVPAPHNLPAPPHPRTRTHAQPTVKLLIDGQMVDSKTSEWVDVVNPATQDVVSRLPLCTEGEFNAAVHVRGVAGVQCVLWLPACVCV